MPVFVSDLFLVLNLHKQFIVSKFLVEINNELERRIVDIFDVFDIAGNHTCDVREIGSIMRALGMCPTEAEVQEFVIKAEDLKAPGTIKLTKIMPLLVELLQEKKYFLHK